VASPPRQVGANGRRNFPSTAAACEVQYQRNVSIVPLFAADTGVRQRRLAAPWLLPSPVPGAALGRYHAVPFLSSSHPAPAARRPDWPSGPSPRASACRMTAGAASQAAAAARPGGAGSGVGRPPARRGLSGSGGRDAQCQQMKLFTDSKELWTSLQLSLLASQDVFIDAIRRSPVSPASASLVGNAIPGEEGGTDGGREGRRREGGRETDSRRRPREPVPERTSGGESAALMRRACA
jgi:hypothetical protein